MRSSERSRGVALLAVLVLTAAACGQDRHEPLREELDALPVPGGLTMVTDVELGSDTGFAGSDPSVHRYYVSASPPETLCLELSSAFTEFSEGSREGAACTFQGPSPEGRPVTITVTGPQSSIPPGDDTNQPTPIDAPHEAVLIVGIG